MDFFGFDLWENPFPGGRETWRPESLLVNDCIREIRFCPNRSRTYL
jgi:hypothetical protein